MARIVVVDDEPSLLKLILRVLAADGHEVNCFQTHDGALSHLRMEGADLVLTDYHMPGMHFGDFLTSITGIRREVPILIMSGDPSLNGFDPVSAIHHSHPFSAIEKPFAPRELAMKVVEAVSRPATDR